MNFLKQRDRNEKELEQMYREVMIEYEIMKERWEKHCLLMKSVKNSMINQSGCLIEI